MRRVAVLMTVHNRKDKTLMCMSQIYNMTLPDDVQLEIYMTDDGCTDGTPEAVSEMYPEVHIVSGDGTLFWNKGMYLAWNEASKTDPDYFLWLNDDTYLYADTLLKLLSVSEAKADKSIIIGDTCDTETKSTITYGGKTRNGSYVFDSTNASPCFYMNGNIVLIPDHVFRIVGYNDPYYSHAMGDYDYGLMAAKKGVDIYVAPGFCGECDLHDCISTWKNPDKSLCERWQAFFKPTGANPFEFFYYRKKNYGVFPACCTFVSNFLHVLFPRFWDNDRR